MWGKYGGEKELRAAAADPSVRPSECVFPPSAANLIADIDHHLFCQNLTTTIRHSGGEGGAAEAINANGLNIIATAAAITKREEKSSRRFGTENWHQTERRVVSRPPSSVTGKSGQKSSKV